MHKILVIDDDPANMALVTNALGGENLEVLAASNGETGLLIALEEHPDIIILDWQMPQMDGIEFLIKKRQIPEIREIMVIMMTGIRTDTDDLLKAYQEGVIEFIRKPVVNAEIQVRIKALLQLSDLHREKIEIRNQELLNVAIKTVELNQIIDEVIDLLNNQQIFQNLSDSSSKQYNDLKLRVSGKLTRGVWKQFEENFTKTYPAFYSRLLEMHPDLTRAELKLCALLRLNLDSKEIAAILCQEYDSIRVSRTRLRRKMNLEQDTNLTSYLIKI